MPETARPRCCAVLANQKRDWCLPRRPDPNERRLSSNLEGHIIRLTMPARIPETGSDRCQQNDYFSLMIGSSEEASSAKRRARTRTSSNMDSVSVPVKVFLWLGW